MRGYVCQLGSLTPVEPSNDPQDMRVRAYIVSNGWFVNHVCVATGTLAADTEFEYISKSDRIITTRAIPVMQTQWDCHLTLFDHRDKRVDAELDTGRSRYELVDYTRNKPVGF